VAGQRRAVRAGRRLVAGRGPGYRAEHRAGCGAGPGAPVSAAAGTAGGGKARGASGVAPARRPPANRRVPAVGATASPAALPLRSLFAVAQ